MKSSTRLVLRKVFALLFCLAFVMASIGIGPSRVVLAAGGTYTSTVVDNDTDGPNGLSSITSKVTIDGKEDATIQRSSVGGTPELRLFHTSSVSDLNIRNGKTPAEPAGSDQDDGSIHSVGALEITSGTLSGNGSFSPLVIAATMAPTPTTTTILTDTPDPSLFGEAIWVEFQVVPNPSNGQSVDGTITVNDGTGATCSRTVDPSTGGWPYPNGWRWHCRLYPTSAGAKTLTAIFVPSDSNLFSSSTSTGVSHLVEDNHPPDITEGSPVNRTMSMDGIPDDFDLTLNSTDDDGDTLTWSIFTPPTYGMATASGVGNSVEVHYDPEWNYHGNDSFVVQVADATLTDTITVNVTVEEGGTIIINKNTSPASGGDFVFHSNIPEAGSFDLNHGETETINNVHLGNYWVAEADPEGGYTLTDLSCTSNANATVDTDLDARQADLTLDDPDAQVECTFTNSAGGTIIIEKRTDPSTSSGDFIFSTDIQGDEVFALTGNGTKTITDVPIGTYHVIEADPDPGALPEGYVLTELECRDEGTQDSTEDVYSRQATIVLASNETVTCIFTNTTDYDSDGILNSDECWGTLPNCVDTDNDGKPDYQDLDSDGDGLLDFIECPDPSDCTDSESGGGDGLPDYRESYLADSDGDGVTDQYDDTNDGDSVDDDSEASYSDDEDQDGILDCFENNSFDSDGDGQPDYNDDDADGDGIDDGCHDDVHLCERFADTDNDSIPNRLEHNTFNSDGRGLPNYLDIDSDEDGEFDGTEQAFNDGENDGVPDRLESDEADSDGDGTVDEADSDSDGDGDDDGDEGLFTDSDDDGIPDYYESNSADSDGDGTVDEEDPDSDADGYLDGGLGGERYADKDQDGIPDRYEHNTADSDADGDPDYDDTNSDNDGGDDGGESGEEGLHDDADGDGIPDRYESNTADSDGDGTPDQQDQDSDEDGIDDGCHGSVYICEGFGDEDSDRIPDRYESNIADSDANGMADYQDADSDGDGELDGDEGFADSGDGDSIPDRLESSKADSDGDGTVDEEDSNSDNDSTSDGDAGERLLDDDEDSVPNRLEADNHYSDGDKTADENDTDSDDDGDPDGEEALADTDEDSIPDRLESDDADSDADGIVDEMDTDSDGDGSSDGYIDASDTGEGLGDDDGDHVPDRYESSIRYSDGVITTNGFTVTVGVPVGNGDTNAGSCSSYPGTDQCDTDSDDDGIPDGCYGTITVCEKFDDTDNDGVANRLESNVADSDNDGIKDFEDYDSDNDDVTDHVEGLKDDDNDNMPDRLESRKADSDGDGRYDERDTNSDDDSTSDGPEGFADSDSDGIQNRFESDNHYSDTDDTSDQNDPDADDDGIPDGCNCEGIEGGCHDNILVCEGFVDTDYDHIPDRYESNTIDTDADGDEDYLDTDSDDDGIYDGDFNCNGTPNEGEGLYDADGDHVPDRVEPLWHYSDGADDLNDRDSSGTAFPLIADGTYTGTYDGDLPDHATLAYTGTDQYDFNCDDDDAGPDGYYNGGEGLKDSDGDGILDRFESSIADSDGDGITDTLDIDSDDDGDLDGDYGERLDDPEDQGYTRDDDIPNRIESSIAHSEGNLTEGDVDELDDNSDNNDESDDNVNERLRDDGDGDGIPDRLEADDHYSDANAKDSSEDCPTGYPTCDDEHDKDADNDGIPDGDFDGNGIDHQGEGLADSDGDYVPDRLEHNFRDTDGDGDPDSEDKDADNDGYDDGIEWLQDFDDDLIPDRLESNTTDTDGDGLKDYEDTDADGDNITDTVEILDANPGPGTSMPGDDGFLGDRDNDGVWNYIDYDPTGYFYNKATGEIIASSEISIAVEGPPGAVITITHYGNEGFYQFSTNGVSGTYTLTLRNGPPTGYALACPAEPDPYNPDPPIDPPYDPADVSTKFNSEISSTGFLSYTGCTPYHWTFDLGMNEDGTSVERDKVIINNNFALVPTVGGVTMKMSVSEAALLSLRVVLLVTMVGMATVINAATHRKRR